MVEKLTINNDMDSDFLLIYKLLMYEERDTFSLILFDHNVIFEYLVF